MDTRIVTYNQREPDVQSGHSSAPRFFRKLQRDCWKRYWLMLCSIFVLGASQVQAADLVNGGSVSGAITVAGEEDTWTLSLIHI